MTEDKTEEQRLTQLAIEAGRLILELTPERRLGWLTESFLQHFLPTLAGDPDVHAQILAYWQRVEEIADQAGLPAKEAIKRVLCLEAPDLVPARPVDREDLERWLVQDRARLSALQLAHQDTPVLPEEVRMVEATIAQLEAELAFLAAKERQPRA